LRGARLRWHVYSSAEEAAAAVTGRLAVLASKAIAARGRFVVVLSGGSTPLPVYQAAAGLETQWSVWHVYLADERCLPPDHTERNDTMLRTTWLGSVPIPPQQIHSIPAEYGAEAGAAVYRETLSEVGPFDLVLLGLGDDGHTASLFPGHPLGAEAGAPDVLAVHDAPKPPPERITLSAARLARADTVLALVLGEGKRAAVHALRERTDIPMRAVAPRNGLDIYLDSAAAGGPPPP
jgi:6-phosphogluconolactonase